MSKQIIHIWKGQEGTMCGLSHYPQEDGFVWLSKMGTITAIQVNCEKCVDSYTKYIDKEIEHQLLVGESKCKTCNGSKKKIIFRPGQREFGGDASTSYEIPCPECQQLPVGELKLDDCNIYLINSELCLPLGDFKAKIIIMCPNQNVMSMIEEYLKRCDCFDRAKPVNGGY